jgi:hypothetical protein
MGYNKTSYSEKWIIISYLYKKFIYLQKLLYGEILRFLIYLCIFEKNICVSMIFSYSSLFIYNFSINKEFKNQSIHIN